MVSDPPGFRCVAVLPAIVALVAAPTASAAPDPAMPPTSSPCGTSIPRSSQDMRATPQLHNFTGAPVDGYLAPTCIILTRPAAEALARAQQQFVEQGYTLKVYDCYRPQRAVNEFVSLGSRSGRSKDEAGKFYPRWTSRCCSTRATSLSVPGHQPGQHAGRHPGRPAARGQPPHLPGQLFDRLAAPQAIGSPTTRSTWAPASTASTPWPTPPIPHHRGRGQEPAAARRGPRAPGIRQLRQGMVALHLQTRRPGTLRGHLFQLPGRGLAGPGAGSISARRNRCMATVVDRSRTSARSPAPAHRVTPGPSASATQNHTVPTGFSSVPHPGQPPR